MRMLHLRVMPPRHGGGEVVEVGADLRLATSLVATTIIPRIVGHGPVRGRGLLGEVRVVHCRLLGSVCRHRGDRGIRRHRTCRDRRHRRR